MKAFASPENNCPVADEIETFDDNQSVYSTSTASPNPSNSDCVKKLDRTCTNCGTSSTSTWRNLANNLVCNACKCFFRKHGRNRPIYMRTDCIKSRRRRSSGAGKTVFKMEGPINAISESDTKAIVEGIYKMMEYLKNL